MLGSSMRIRSYWETDEAGLVHLWGVVFADSPAWNVPLADIRLKLSVQPDLLLVGERGGQIVASAMAGFDGHRGWIYRLAVLPEHRGQGFGVAMLAEAERRLRLAGCLKINLMVRDANRNVLGFYHKQGYQTETVTTLGKRLASPRAAHVADHARPTSDFRIPVGDRWYLAEFRPDDQSDLIQHLNDREIHDRTLLIPFPYTQQDADHWIEHTRQDAIARGFPTQFAIRDTSRRLIGGFSFDTLIEGHRAEIGYWLARPYWGQGIMPAVVSAACEFAWHRWRLVRIMARVFDFNHASARVLEKCGFQFEGLFPKHYLKAGKFIDGRGYALIRE